jgi:predicted transcriptional regulator
MSTEMMSLPEFAKLVGVSRQYVVKYIETKNFKGVISKQKIGKTWVLQVDKKKASKEFED